VTSCSSSAGIENFFITPPGDSGGCECSTECDMEINSQNKYAQKSTDIESKREKHAVDSKPCFGKCADVCVPNTT
jgi:hypothetical protein